MAATRLLSDSDVDCDCQRIRAGLPARPQSSADGGGADRDREVPRLLRTRTGHPQRTRRVHRSSSRVGGHLPGIVRERGIPLSKLIAVRLANLTSHALRMVPMNDATPLPAFSRRTLLKTASSGFGYLAFAGLSTWASERSAGPLAPKAPHFPPRARRVIFLCMEGGPSHVDTFDYKPKLSSDDGKPIGKGGPPPPSCSLRPGNSSSTARAASGSRTCFPRSPSMPTTSASSIACRPTSRTIPRRFSSCTRGSSSSPGPRWARGCSTALEPRTRTSPAWSPFARPAMAGRRTTAAHSCRRSTRGRASDSTGSPSPRPR